MFGPDVLLVVVVVKNIVLASRHVQMVTLTDEHVCSLVETNQISIRIVSSLVRLCNGRWPVGGC